jgi:hypothetical protein
LEVNFDLLRLFQGHVQADFATKVPVVLMDCCMLEMDGCEIARATHKSIFVLERHFDFRRYAVNRHRLKRSSRAPCQATPRFTSFSIPAGE